MNIYRHIGGAREVETNEDENGDYYIYCPKCETRFIMNDSVHHRRCDICTDQENGVIILIDNPFCSNL